MARSGSDNCDSTLAIASAIQNDYAIESVAHLPCVNLTREVASATTAQVSRGGIENILALRGDLPEQGGASGDFQYACDLISLIKEHGDFNIIAARYPEGHLESPDIVSDIRSLKLKVDAGVDHLITQLFSNNDAFYRFRERTALAGIQVPLQAGVMPIINKKQMNASLQSRA
jgi:methylenetetrahydrofolate reductase (NADPH)